MEAGFLGVVWWPPMHAEQEVNGLVPNIERQSRNMATRIRIYTWGIYVDKLKDAEDSYYHTVLSLRR